MDNHENKVKQFFNYSALEKQGYYDHPYSLAYRIQKVIRNKTMGMVITQNPKSILDAGCGPGEFALDLAGENRESKVVGVDFAENMIEKALTLKRDSCLNNLDYQSANLLNLPYPDKEFDLTVCLNVLHLFTPGKQVEVLNELARVTNDCLILEIKNKENFYYYIKKIKEKFIIKGVPTNLIAVKEASNILQRKNFKLTKIVNLLYFKIISPIIILKFESRKYS